MTCHTTDQTHRRPPQHSTEQCSSHKKAPLTYQYRAHARFRGRGHWYVCWRISVSFKASDRVMLWMTLPLFLFPFIPFFCYPYFTFDPCRTSTSTSMLSPLSPTSSDLLYDSFYESFLFLAYDSFGLIAWVTPIFSIWLLQTMTHSSYY